MGLLRADTGSFNRLLVSLGLIALALALIAPWALIREDHALTFTRAELGRMTPRAQQILGERQERVGQMQDAAPFFCAVLLVVGGVLLLKGVWGMKVLAPLEEREARARVHQAEASLTQMTPEEHAQKVQEEAREALLGTAAEMEPAVEVGVDKPEATEPELTAIPAEASAATTAPPAVPSDNVPQTFSSAQTPTYETFVRTEQRVLDLLQHSVPSGYRFRSQVRVMSGDVRLLLDGVFLNTDRAGQDVIVEIKVSANSTRVRQQTRNGADQLLASAVRYSRELGPQLPAVWLIVVVNGPLTPSVTDELRGAVAPHGAVSILERSQLDELEALPWPPELSER